MTPFILPPSRYHELPFPVNAFTSIVIALEDADSKELRGAWVAQDVVHIEPVWLHPSLHGKGFPVMRMHTFMLAELGARDITTYYSFADRSEIANYLSRIGLELQPYTVFKGTIECPSSPSPQSQPQPLEPVEPSLAD